MIFYFCIMAIVLIGSLLYAGWLISFGTTEFISGKRYPVGTSQVRSQEDNSDMKRIQEIETLERNHRIYKDK